jgi:hypothetical protein
MFIVGRKLFQPRVNFSIPTFRANTRCSCIKLNKINANSRYNIYFLGVFQVQNSLR